MHAQKLDIRLTLLMDLLQLPLSLIFTRFLNLFAAVIPVFGEVYPDHFAGSYVGRFLFLLLAIVLTGVGAAMSLNMRLIPNPGDGIVQAIADTIHKSVGFTKNRKNTQMQFRHNLIKLVKMRRCRKIDEIFLHLLFM